MKLKTQKTSESKYIKKKNDLREKPEKLLIIENIINHSPAIFIQWHNKYNTRKIEFISSNIQHFGYESENFCNHKINYTDIICPDDLSRFDKEQKISIKDNKIEYFVQEYRILTKNGDTRWIEERSWINRNKDGKAINYQGILLDISDRKNLEEQLRYSQKMEAIGALTGGIAHDFNNILSVINGYSELALRFIKPEERLFRHLNEVLKAGKRASALVRQLLAFSRRQLLEPEILFLNDHIQEIEKMLKRLIREDIDLQINLDPSVGAIKADPGQIEQIIFNLVVNSSDAMPRGGQLIIKTCQINIDDGYKSLSSEMIAGKYLLLSISDTGIGMDKQTQERIFDPFYTTKKKKMSIGLGLAAVYGIVKQSGGYLNVESEIGKGATFKIYFPIVEEKTNKKSEIKFSDKDLVGNETIMVVEDEDSLRQLICETLRTKSYNVLEASRGEHAIQKCKNYKEDIHLILTDVIMPSISGPELVKQLNNIHSEMKTLYITGYADDTITNHGILDSGVKFLQKPFTPTILTQKVRDVLDAD